MHFLYPQFLWALFLLVIPVIIHFFNIRRYKKIYFSDVRRIKQITQESQVRNKLKEYIILLERLLALLFLILAFAQPVIKKDDNNHLNNKNSDVVIYIDNSFSMENISKNGKLIEISLNKAKEIINSFSKSTKFYILTNDADFQSTKPLSQNESIEYLSKIKITSSSIPLSVIYDRINTLHLNNPILFILSDAQKNFTNIQNIKDKNIITYYLLLSPNQVNNISIDSVWIDNPVVLPNTSQSLHITVTNHNAENVSNIPIKFILNGVQKSIINVSVPAHQSIETTISFMSDNQPFQLAKVFLNDYPVTFDDELYFSINTNIKIKTLLINGADNPASSKYIQSLFQNDSIFTYSEQNEKQINFSELSLQDVIILNEISEFSTGLEEQLITLANKGKTIIIIPKITNNIYSLPKEFQNYQWNIDTSKQTLSNEILKHPLFSAAFEKNESQSSNAKMPAVKNYIYTNYLAYFEPVITLNNSRPLLMKYAKNKWNYFLFTASLNADKNQLPLHAVFVPLMYELSFTSVPNMPLYYYSKSSQNIKIPDIAFSSDNPPKIISVDKNYSTQIIPAYKNQGFSTYINISDYYDLMPGHYYLQSKDKNIFSISFNYNRSESNMEFYTENELKNLITQYHLKNVRINEVTNLSAQKIIQSEISGQSYWKLCLILCLIFFVSESLTIRFFK